MRPLIVTVVDRASGAEERHAFLRSPVTVGRAEGNDLPLEASFVSARHGILQFDAGEVHYTDLGSRNGTRVGTVRLARDAPTAVAPGGELRIGELVLRLDRGPPPAPATTGSPPPRGALTALLQRLARTTGFDAADAALFALGPGRVLGRFELVREIGRGGFGVVFEARDRRLGRRVALKAVRPGRHEARVAGGWLEREAETVAQLNHPNIVSLHDVGAWEGGSYLIMELLEGEPLDARLARGPLEPGEALRVAIDIARALAHAHGAGVVHRDLKPSNVFLLRQGWAKVLDFGLAQVLGGDAPLRAGTPQYMAPEQRRGEPADPRTDVYAAALVLRESLGERVPEAVAALLADGLAEARAARPADGGGWLDGLLAVERALAAGGPTP